MTDKFCEGICGRRAGWGVPPTSPLPSQVRGEARGLLGDLGHCLLEVDPESYSLTLCGSAMGTCRFEADWRTRECLEELDLSPLLWRA